jgi:hypothetical protein
MKVMIEINLSEGQKIPTSDDILRLTSPDWISHWWHIDDCRGFLDYELTDDEYREVLRRVNKYHDCNEGITWLTIEHYVDSVASERVTV